MDAEPIRKLSAIEIDKPSNSSAPTSERCNLSEPRVVKIMMMILMRRFAVIFAATFVWAAAAVAQGQLPTTGTINGTIVDASGALVSGAHVRLTRSDSSAPVDITSGEDGQFAFAHVMPGEFHVTVTAPGFNTQVASGVLHAGETFTVPAITMRLVTEHTEVKVVADREEIAEAQIKEQEQQRVLGFIPNFYVSYVPDAAPLNSKQKFELAWRSTLDPVNIVLNGVNAGLEQAENAFGRYGQGAQGYGKRLGASLADSATSTFIGGYILPSLLKQDPRYFYKGTGSVKSRVLYAIAMSVVARGDNQRWQPNYSGILGSLAGGGISNLYYPPNDRGVGLVFEGTGIGIAATAASNIFQEFIVKRFTPSLANRRSSPPSSQP